MAQNKSAEKRARQSEGRRLRNKIGRSQVKSILKKVKQTKQKEESEKIMKEAVSLLDRYSAKGIIHKNFAANKKRNLMRHLNNLNQ